MDMKTAKLTLMFLACAAASTAFAQNTTDSRCGTTNFDRNQNLFTITNPTPGTVNQQCFFTVVPKASWRGGVPDLASSQLVEGNYEVVLSGGGGAGGGGIPGSDADRDHTKNSPGGGGNGGSGAVPVTAVRYLKPGVYRMTIGAGGQGGASNGGHGGNGAPTSLSNAYTGETVAGFPRAESWDGRYPPQYAQTDGGSGLMAMAYLPGASAKDGEHGPGGGTGGAGGKEAGERGNQGGGGNGGAGDKEAGDHGNQGGNGFIKMALKDPVPLAAPAPAMSSTSESLMTPAPAATRPPERDDH
jgi:hypothetical protein